MVKIRHTPRTIPLTRKRFFPSSRNLPNWFVDVKGGTVSLPVKKWRQESSVDSHLVCRDRTRHGVHW